MRAQPGHQAVRGVLLEDDDVIDRSQSPEDLGALGGGHERTPAAFEPTHGRVPVQSDEEDVTEPARGFQIADMPDVEQIEAAIGQHDALAVGPQAFG